MGIHTGNCLSICSGTGALDLGVRLASEDARTICYIEREAYNIATLVAGIENGLLDNAPIWTDLASFDSTAWRGKVDTVFGGIPCQPFSFAGQHRGASDDRDLWPITRRHIEALRPGCIFLENVPGIAEYYYHTIRPELSGLGYRVAEGLFTAQEVGAPHERQRLFILAYAHCGDQQVSGISPGNLSESESGFNLQSGSPLADSNSQRPQWAGPGPSIIEGAGSIFPPGPGSAEEWAYLQLEMPETQPAFCGMAYGAAHWLYGNATTKNRLQSLGNAVVPVAVANALLTLHKRLMNG